MVASSQGNVRGKISFQGQGKVGEFYEKSRKIFGCGKVREKSGNFVMPAMIFIAVDTFLFLILVPHMDAGLGNPCIFFYAMRCFSSITVSWEENMCVGHSLLTYHTYVYILLQSSQQGFEKQNLVNLFH